jgi:hypothetical protein
MKANTKINTALIKTTEEQKNIHTQNMKIKQKNSSNIVMIISLSHIWLFAMGRVLT